mgnify:CR=1 FL=1
MLLPMILVIATLVVAFILYDLHRTLDSARLEASKLVSTLAEHTHQVMTGAHRNLAHAASQIAPSDLVGAAAGDRVQQLLDSHGTVAGGLYLIDAGGRSIVRSHGEPELPPAVRDEVAAAVRAGAGNELQIGRPVVDPHGHGVLPVAHPLLLDGGESRGSLVAALPLGPLERFLAALSVDGAGVAGLVRDDGLLLLRRPVSPAVGTGIVDVAATLTAVARSGGVTQRQSMVDGTERLLAFRKVPRYELFAYVGLSRDTALSGWRTRSLVIGGVAALSCGLLLAVAAVGDRRVARRRRRESALTEKLSRLALASIEMNRLRRLEPLCERSVDVARELVGTRHAHIRLTVDGGGQSIYRSSTSPVEGPSAGARLTTALVGTDGRNLGFIEVAGKDQGDFDGTDEGVLVQLGRLVASQTETITSAAERDQALQAARDAHIRAEQVISSIPDAFFVLDNDWKFTFVNAFATAATGRGDLLGRNVFEAFPAIIDTELHQALLQAGETQVARSIECHFPPMDDYCDLRLSPFPEGLSVYARSVRKRREMEAQLHQAQKMEVVGRLTGGVAHDFNNLLTVIVGSQEMILDSAAPGSPERAAAEMALQAAERAGELTQRLLAFARRQVLEPRAVDVAAQLRGVEGLIKRLIGETVTLRLQPGLGLWRAHVDPTQLETAILNIAVNARDAMPRGGSLTIEASNVWIDAASPAEHGHLSPGQYVMIALTDTGEGMAADVALRAFEPFFTTKPVGKGSGLGLSMVYGFVKQSGGDVEIRSREGEGTTVTLYLPRALAVSEEVDRTRLVGTSGGNEQVLVVEDNEEVRRYIETVLTQLGYEVVAVGEGAPALAKLDEGVACDLLVTDVVLPGGLNGAQLADEVRRRLPRLPVIFISGYAESILAEAQSVPPGRLLTKPFRAWELATRVREALDATAIEIPG